MKRDWQLLGEIFTHIENDDLESFIDNDNERSDLILRHLELLIDADFVRGVEVRRSNNRIIGYSSDDPRITLQGYDFAEIVADKKLCKKVISAIEKAGYLVSFETLKAFAPKIVMQIASSVTGL